MEFKRFLPDLTGWENIVHSAVFRFRKDYGVNPNLLLASSETFAKVGIHFGANNQGDLFNGDAEEQPVGLFRTPGFQLELYIDESVPDFEIKLVYNKGNPGPSDTHGQWGLPGTGLAAAPRPEQNYRILIAAESQPPGLRQPERLTTKGGIDSPAGLPSEQCEPAFFAVPAPVVDWKTSR